jgi:hypothetical protein
MTYEPSTFKYRLLRRVYGIWFFRRAAPLLIIELIILALAMGFFTQYVFVERVVSNALASTLGNPFRILSYLWLAFIKTRKVTKVIVIVVLGGGIFLLRDVNRSILAYVAMRRRELFSRTPKEI